MSQCHALICAHCTLLINWHLTEKDTSFDWKNIPCEISGREVLLDSAYNDKKSLPEPLTAKDTTAKDVEDGEMVTKENTYSFVLKTL